MAEGNIVANLMRRRDLAAREGDVNLVREFDFELARYGVVVRMGEVMDRYEPSPAKRGRPRKNVSKETTTDGD